MVTWTILFLSVSLIAADKCSVFYKKKEICDTTYGTVLATYENIRSVLGCSVRCDGTPLCQSFVYNATSRTCDVNSQTLLAPQTPCGSDVKYAEAQETSCSSSSSHSAAMPNPTATTTMSSQTPIPTGPTMAASTSTTLPTTTTSSQTPTTTGSTMAASTSTTLPTTTTSSQTPTTTGPTMIPSTSTSPTTATYISPAAPTTTGTTTDVSTTTMMTVAPATSQSPTTTDLTADAFCTGGTRYDPVSASCVTECTGSYSTTFQYDPQRRPSFFGCRDEEFEMFLANPEQCRQLCISETSFVCATFYMDYILLGLSAVCTVTDCTLAAATAVYTDITFAMWHRDCQ